MANDSETGGVDFFGEDPRGAEDMRRRMIERNLQKNADKKKAGVKALMALAALVFAGYISADYAAKLGYRILNSAPSAPTAPKEPKAPTSVKRGRVNLAVVDDRSQSMKKFWTSMQPALIEFVKKAGNGLLQEGDSITFCTVAGDTKCKTYPFPQGSDSLIADVGAVRADGKVTHLTSSLEEVAGDAKLRVDQGMSEAEKILNEFLEKYGKEDIDESNDGKKEKNKGEEKDPSLEISTVIEAMRTHLESVLLTFWTDGKDEERKGVNPKLHVAGGNYPQVDIIYPQGCGPDANKLDEKWSETYGGTVDVQQITDVNKLFDHLTKVMKDLQGLAELQAKNVASKAYDKMLQKYQTKLEKHQQALEEHQRKLESYDQKVEEATEKARKIVKIFLAALSGLLASFAGALAIYNRLPEIPGGRIVDESGDFPRDAILPSGKRKKMATFPDLGLPGDFIFDPRGGLCNGIPLEEGKPIHQEFPNVVYRNLTVTPERQIAKVIQSQTFRAIGLGGHSQASKNGLRPSGIGVRDGKRGLGGRRGK